MPLVGVGTEPIPGLRWLRFLWVPSRRQTKKAKRGLKDTYSWMTKPLIQAFINGKLDIETVIKVKERTLVLKGVYPEMGFPEAMVFWDPHKGWYYQFTRWEELDGFQIVK